MSLNLAYLAQGKLHLKLGDEPVRTIESKFAQTVRDRALRQQQQHGWKNEGRGARFMSRGLVWGQGAQRDPAEMRVAITGLSRGRELGELLYTLEVDQVTGIFAVRDGGNDELRLSHSADRHLQFVSARPNQELVACSVWQKSGTANIATKRAEGGALTEVTEGDSTDLAPQWIPGSPRQLVFQSAGVMRDRDGRYSGLGPYTIQRLDLDSGNMTCLAEEADSDFLGPQIAADGSLYFLRRPYHSPHERISPWRFLWSIVCMPFRFLFAIFQFFNFFTLTLTGKPLIDASGAKQQEMDVRRLMIWGNLIDADKAIRGARRAGEDSPSLVPKSWELIRKARDGTEHTVARGVLSFDLCPDGSLVYTNGSVINRVDPHGTTERLLSDQLIEQVVALD